jgi:FKBP-type peptidyl-prolyl cis-trans isomerase
MKHKHPGARSLALVTGACLLLGGCKHISLDTRPVGLQRSESLTPSGVHVRELFLGEGRSARQGDLVVMDYTVWLLDGTRVDSTLDRGVPIEVRIGSAPIEGWNEGLMGVMPDGRRQLLIPARLAYGSEGFGDLVPPDADLRFEVHVLEVRPQG